MDRETFKRKVYITYRCRIITAERLKRTESFIQGLNIYYSLCLTAFSIYSIYNSTARLSIILTIASVMVTVSIVFLSTKRYGERSKGLKNNYISLDKLYRDILNAEQNQLADLEDQYTSLLNDSENHNKFDYYAAIIDMEDEKEKISKKKRVCYYIREIICGLLALLLILIPFGLKYIANLIEWIIVM